MYVTACLKSWGNSALMQRGKPGQKAASTERTLLLKKTHHRPARRSHCWAPNGRTSHKREIETIERTHRKWNQREGAFVCCSTLSPRKKTRSVTEEIRGGGLLN